MTYDTESSALIVQPDEHMHCLALMHQKQFIVTCRVLAVDYWSASDMRTSARNSISLAWPTRALPLPLRNAHLGTEHHIKLCTDSNSPQQPLAGEGLVRTIIIGSGPEQLNLLVLCGV